MLHAVDTHHPLLRALRTLSSTLTSSWKCKGVPWLCRHHHDRVKKLVVEPGNPHVIVSCGEDGVGASLDCRIPPNAMFIS